MNNKVIAIIVARMGSSRLPGKILLELNRVPLLKRVYDRVKQCKRIDKIIVATTHNKKDDELVDFCKANEIEVFRGSEEDVLGRFYQCALNENKEGNLKAVVRITADAPFVDPELTDKMILNLINGELDYNHNRHLQGPPLGCHAEVISFETLEKLNMEVTDKTEREHITLHILKPENRNKFKIKLDDAPKELQRPEYRLLLDEQKDFSVVTRIYQELGEFPKLEEIISYLDTHPEIKKLNEDAHLDFKDLLDK